MKLCKDCAFYRKPRLFGLFSAECKAAPDPIRVTDPVTGEWHWHGNKSCAAQRAWRWQGYCGPDGMNFEPNKNDDQRAAARN